MQKVTRDLGRLSLVRLSSKIMWAMVLNQDLWNPFCQGFHLYTCHTTCDSEVPCMSRVTSVSQLWSSCSSMQFLAPWAKDWMPPSARNTHEGEVPALKNWIAFVDLFPLILSILDCSGNDLRRKGVGRNSEILSCSKVCFRGHLCPHSPANEDITKLLKWQRG